MALFRVQHAGAGQFWGRFNDVTGTVEYSRDDSVAPVFDVAVATKSIDTGTAKRGVAVNLAHVLADFVANSPRRLVGHGKLALQFLGADTVACRGEQVHGVEPLLQRGTRLLKRRPGHGADLVSAPRAFVNRTLFDAVELARLAALRAFRLIAVADGPKVVQTSVVGREAFEKLKYGLRGHLCSFQYRDISKSTYMTHGDKPQSSSG